MIVRNARNILKFSTNSGLIHTTANVGYKSLVDVHPEVQNSLRHDQPIVALESTIITHGMPYPQNLETAIEVEELVRKNGATPATIAICDGRIKVGLSSSDLKNLAAKQQTSTIKCSRRDLAYVVANGLSGGTTVAATMMISHWVGLRIFATGGIGGVHREGHVTMDVSADLVELGRTPVAVVCSGVKSILDIPRTLEYLETQGVCVATYGNKNNNFPDFYTRDSGCKVPYNLQGPTDAARLIRTAVELNINSGILIGVPIPEAYAVDKKQIDEAIALACEQARHEGVYGKSVTPFLLAAIAKITKGNSLYANMALIKNNAVVAAEIARELYSAKSNRPLNEAKRESKAPVVIGASILDLSLTMLDDMPSSLNGATYQTKAKQSAGGVGRNLAEGIFKLHGQAKFISVVGDDQIGQSLLKLIPQPLREDVQIDDENSTSLCSVIFDKAGDCRLILGNMEIHQKITSERIAKHASILQAAPLIVMDGNLPVSTMECILNLAKQYERPVFFEPTDMRISGKPFTLPNHLTEQIKFISPNIYELKTIVEAITKHPIAWEPNIAIQTKVLLQKAKQMIECIEGHFDCILITLGHHGVLLSIREDALSKPLFDTATGSYRWSTNSAQKKPVLRFYAAPNVDPIINVSGAGDSFSSGFITGLLRGYEIEHCIAMGFIAAERALRCTSAVPTQYFSNDQEESALLQETLSQLEKLDV